MSFISLRGASIAALVALALQPARVLATTLPPGFTEVVVVSGLNQPTSFAFLPDGRMLISEKGGTIRVFKNNVLLATPAITLAVSSDGERGAFCITPHPLFPSNHFVYVYYTTSAGSLQRPNRPFDSPRNRVSRFTLSGDTFVPSSEVVILEAGSETDRNNGGWVQFGPDGKLYVSTGDASFLASGQILRINADGTIPADNPVLTRYPYYLGIWCYGLRNPWRAAWDVSGRLFIGDRAFTQEINLGLPGKDYSFHYDFDSRFEDPIYEYKDFDTSNPGGAGIAVGVFNNGGRYPAQYAGALFFADSTLSFIRTLKYVNGNAQVTNFALGAGRPVHFANGPDGLIYYASDETNQIRRIEFPANSTAIPVPADYDGDRIADMATFSTKGTWVVRRSSDGGTRTRGWGTSISTYTPVPADYNGDGTADFAVYRADLSRWRIFLSTGERTIDWGRPGSTPVAADYDGDHVTDLATFQGGYWWLRYSSGRATEEIAFMPQAGDIPIPRDFDGDRKADIAVFRPATSQWLVRRSSDGVTTTTPLGQSGDMVVPADFDGDGRADRAIFRPSNGWWRYRRSSDSVIVNVGWGAKSDAPAPADFDGDRKADIAVYRSVTGQWFIRRSSDGRTTIYP